MEVDERRAHLLRIGGEIFAEQSYDELSIEDIARAAGVSKGLLYHYFGGKRDFYLATIRAGASDLIAATETDPDLPGLERLAASLDAHLDYVEAHAKGYVALVRGAGADAEVQAIVDETRAYMINRIVVTLTTEVPAPPLLWLAVSSWMGLTDQASIDYLEGNVERALVHGLMVQTLGQAITTAVQLDPSIKLDALRL